MAATLQQQIAVVPTRLPERFISVSKPGRMGNSRDIAYGGCAIGAAIRAAHETVDTKYRLYSALGHYLGPASAEAKLHCTVHRVRDTRTFSTRQVVVSQTEEEGEEAFATGRSDKPPGAARLCLIALIDFQIPEKSLVLPEYSAPPDRIYSRPEQCPTIRNTTDRLLREGVVSQPLVDMFYTGFGLQHRFFESRGCPESVGANTLWGLTKKRASTPQDGRTLTDKTSADWFRSRHPLETHADHYAGLGFVLDGALSFLPLTHSGLFLDDAGPCSSLDFALRCYGSDIDLGQWHLREIKTITGQSGRTYSESRLWDDKGNLVANMTQQSILRPARPAASL